ncbi:MAG: penicillin-binding transpeptidase domain-containing protein [Anaerolineae bacterium]|nr:penicillin-binding transpeptidase domain-containing protein [Anaerolineae bacterium]
MKTYRQRIIIIFVWILLGLSVLPTWAQSTPQEVVNAFLDGWNAKDYERMYRLVTVNNIGGVDEYPLQVFTNRYETVTDTLALTELRYTITRTELQGMTAMVVYDVTFVSNTFGEIPDTGRMMRLINTPNGWKIAWSTMDIFDTLISGAQIRIESRPSPRAVIYDRNGERIAYSGTTTGFYSARNRMVGEQQCIELLARLQRVPIRLLERQFQPNIPETVFFLGELNTDVFNANFSALSSVCGVRQGVESNPHRIYEGNSMGTHVLGYVGPIPAEQLAQYTALGYGAGDIVGLSGIEEAYQTELGGKPASVLRIVDSSGTVLRELAGSAGTPPVPITVTLDARLQQITADALNEAFIYANPDWASVSTGGAAVVLDVQTGEILALASYPFIQPNLFNPESVTVDRGNALASMLGTGDPLRNRAVTEQASPGSVFKIITMAAALNEGLTTPTEQFNCELYWDGSKYGDTRSPRPDWRVTDEMAPAGMIIPAEALMASCNPFFWEFGARLFLEKNPNMIAEYGRRMGLTQTYNGLSPIYRRQAPGVIPIPGSVDAAVSEAVGQGDVTLPPLQMGVVTASIANGGTVYSPSLVKQIGGADGVDVVQTFTPQILNEFNFNAGVLEAIQTGMCGVTTNEFLGTAYGRFVSKQGSEFSYTDLTAPYSVCGKTGTAQTGLYPNAWFVAYAPADDPQIAVVVMVEQSLEGSQVSAPIARRILDDYFNVQRDVYPVWWSEGPYEPLNIPPDGGAGG